LLAPATVERPGARPTITKGSTTMTDPTPTLTIHALGSIAWHLSYRALAAECGDLELTGKGEIPAAALTELREVWGILLAERDYVAADWLAAMVNARGSGDPSRRFDRLADGLGPLAADGGHLTLICEDGPWNLMCESCSDHTPGDAPAAHDHFHDFLRSEGRTEYFAVGSQSQLG